MYVYLLIEVEPAKTKAVLDQLRNVSNLIEVHQVMGPYDLIAKVEAPTTKELSETTRKAISTIIGVTRIVQLVVLDRG